MRTDNYHDPTIGSSDSIRIIVDRIIKQALLAADRASLAAQMIVQAKRAMELTALVPTADESLLDEFIESALTARHNSGARIASDAPMLAAALKYAAKGWWVFPAPPGTKKSHKSIKFSGRRWGVTTNPKIIRKDFTKKFPNANVAIATGIDSGIFVIEADTHEGHDVDGLASITELETKHGRLPETLIAISPSGSVHRYYKHPGAGIKIWNSNSAIAPGVDVRGDGGMVIAPPSIKSHVGEYRWLNENQIADAPAWLIDAASKANTSTSTPKRKTPSKPSTHHVEKKTRTEFKLRQAEADLARIEAALMTIPNDASVNWTEWNRIAMALFNATGGSSIGFAMFDRWSQKYPGYNYDDTAARWQGIQGSPPDAIHAATIFYLADQASPAWLSHYRLMAMVDVVDKGSDADEDNPPPKTNDTVAVEAARGHTKNVIDKFIDKTLQFHTTPGLTPCVIDFNPKLPPHGAIKTTTGSSKSELKRHGSANFVIEQKRRSHPRYRVMFTVPMHRLADEASGRMMKVFSRVGVTTAIYQSREGKDMQTGEPLCCNFETVRAAQAVGLDVQSTCCKKGKIKCPFFDDCGFQRQRKRARKANVVFATHEVMFQSLNRFGKKDSFGLVIIDEVSCSRVCCTIRVRPGSGWIHWRMS